MTHPIQPLVRPQDGMGEFMRRVSKVFLTIGAFLLLLAGCGYRIEESATWIPIAVIWDGNVSLVECCRFSELAEAKKYYRRERNAPKHRAGNYCLNIGAVR